MLPALRKETHTVDSGEAVLMKFVADSMLGKMATWLRILGYDTLYQPLYGEGELAGFIRQGRCLVTRDRSRWQGDAHAVVLDSQRVGDQLKEFYIRLELHPVREKWFTRCLRCNVLLEDANEGEAQENVPEYVFYEHRGKLKFCRLCGRYFWPGSHRQRMVKQLGLWGIPGRE